MGITGPGTGGTAQPSQIREAETTAFVENMKRTLALIPWDTMEVLPFTQADFDSLFKYRTEPDRPTLHPLQHLRLSMSAADIEEATWGPIYDDLFKGLPEEVQEWLDAELAKPIEARNLNAIVLSTILAVTSQAIEWLNGVTEPVDPNSPEAMNAELNAIFPHIVLEGILNNAQEIMTLAEKYLNTIGPNDPNYDLLTNLLNEMGEILEDLGEMKTEVENAG